MEHSRTRTPAPRQVLLRLPEDVADQLARTVAPRRRNQFLVDVVAEALADRRAQQDRALAEAAQYLNELEAKHPELARDTDEWVNATLTEPVDTWDPDFDRDAFELGFAEAQAARCAAPAPTDPQP